jgi:hypothetical protein
MKKPPRLKRYPIKFSIPGEAKPIFENYVHRLRHFYANEREYVESVVAYSLWCEQEHHLTGPSFRNRETRRKMWDEIIADFGKSKKSGSYFLHRVEEFAQQKGTENK